MAELSYAQVSALLKYDSDTGRLFWLERPAEFFSAAVRSGGAEAAAKTWNTKYAGSEAFTAIDGRGYHYGHIFKMPFRLHRVGWLLHYGFWPKDQIDHINGIRTDNRIGNLRDVTCAENHKNHRVRSDSRSGVPGVGWCNRKMKWRARIMEAGRETHVGYFDDFETAVTMRKKAEAEHGFHSNHGRSG